MAELGDGDNKKPLGKKGITELIAQMEQQNKTAESIDTHSRNSRRHLLEMKKMTNNIMMLHDANVQSGINLTETMLGDRNQKKEDDMEMKKVFVQIRDALVQGGGDSEAAKEEKKKTSMIGKAMKGAGFGIGLGLVGAGLAINGIGLIANALPKMIDSIENLDVDKIQKSVDGLLGIPKSLNDGDVMETFAETGTFYVMMTGLGAGLMVFGAGTAVSAAADKFAGPEFATNIKNSVETLLSIGDSNGGNLDTLGDAGTVTLALTGLGIGLAIFGAGSSVGLGADALGNFTNKTWAESIKNNVLTLLSIANGPDGKTSSLDTLGKSGAVTLALTGLGIGLAIYGAGSSVGMSADALSNFANPNWAESIKHNVLTLLSISDEAGGNVKTLKKGGTITLALSGLGIGLALFGAGGAAAAGAQTLQKKDFAENIKHQVLTLLSIADYKGDLKLLSSESSGVTGALSKLGVGLAVFGGGQAYKALGDYFSKPGWAKKTKADVENLLSIGGGVEGNLLNKAQTVEASLKGLSRGLSAFGGEQFKNAIGNMVGSWAKWLTISEDKEDPIDMAIRVSRYSTEIKDAGRGIKDLASGLNILGDIDDPSDGFYEGLGLFIGLGKTQTFNSNFISHLDEVGDSWHKIASGIQMTNKEGRQFLAIRTAISQGLTMDDMGVTEERQQAIYNQIINSSPTQGSITYVTHKTDESLGNATSTG